MASNSPAETKHLNYKNTPHIDSKWEICVQNIVNTRVTNTGTTPSYTWHVGPLHWTRVTRVTTNQDDHSDEDDQSDLGDEDYQGDQCDQGDEGDRG